ncbi:class II glutamine amidotransferase [bacterium 210820-DFI.6.37]|nr:class II glutamine amidotransferase [bacterium 210820-DFI.6.37]
MCELFGLTSNKTIDITDYLQSFFRRSNMHPHGWGLACMEGSSSFIEKESLQATRSNYLKERLSADVEAAHAFGHIRYATIGNVEYGNCHPYTLTDLGGRRWTQIHNGSIFDYPGLDKYINCQKGSTDSERILMHLVEQINLAETERGRPLSGKERFELLDRIFIKMSVRNKLNLLLFDGEYTYVHTNYKDSLYYLEKGGGTTLFSTAPLTEENWKPVPFTRLLAYKNGALVFTGTNHENQYEDREEDLKFLYQIFSSL